MRDGAFADVGDDLHVGMRMRREAGPGGDLVVVPNAQAAPSHARGIVVTREGKVVFRFQPTVVGTAQFGEFSAFDGVNSSSVVRLAPLW